MTALEAILLAVVEGLTEFLPVSSTGHLILTCAALDIPDAGFLRSFIIAVQLGSIAAVVLLYWRRFLQDRQTLLRVLAAFVPTMIIGFALYSVVKQYLLASPPLVLLSLAIGGVVILLFEWRHGERRDAFEGIASMRYWQAAVVGLFQALAIIPGVSRSGITVIGGLLLGMRRATIVEFSFLLAAPTLVAATCFDLYKSAGDFSGEQVGLLLLGVAVAFVVALVAIKSFLHYVKAHTLAVFGAYRIVVALAFTAWLYL